MEVISHRRVATPRPDSHEHAAQDRKSEETLWAHRLDFGCVWVHNPLFVRRTRDLHGGKDPTRSEAAAELERSSVDLVQSAAEDMDISDGR